MKINDLDRCHACGMICHIDDLDCKDDGTGNYTIQLCGRCYGPTVMQKALNALMRVIGRPAPYPTYISVYEERHR